MLDRIIERLSFLGYAIQAEDEWTLEFILEKVESHIQSTCNVFAVPNTLSYAAVDLAVAEFLREKKAAGGLSGFDLDCAIKQIQEGDTSVTYAVGDDSSTSGSRLDALIDCLERSAQEELVSWRRMRW